MVNNNLNRTDPVIMTTGNVINNASILNSNNGTIQSPTSTALHRSNQFHLNTTHNNSLIGNISSNTNALTNSEGLSRITNEIRSR